MRNLILVLGDQLDAKSAAFDGFDAKRDAVWMAEVSGEAEHVWLHKARIAIFLAAVRHFRDELRARGVTVHYTELDAGRARPPGAPTPVSDGRPGGPSLPMTFGEALAESFR
jgi:deoxyribodipyrimidine photolyase-related protein